MTWTDVEGKNVFHHFAKRNFDQALGLLIRNLPPAEVKDMILQRSLTNGSNVLMTSATYSSGKALELLLHFLSMFYYTSGENSPIDMDHVLHHRNAYGNTLLSLVLQHKDALQVPKSILLGMEREFHSRDDRDDMTHCFHKNLTPSGEVLEAILEVEKGKKKGAFAVGWIYPGCRGCRVSSKRF